MSMMCIQRRSEVHICCRLRKQKHTKEEFVQCGYVYVCVCVCVCVSACLGLLRSGACVGSVFRILLRHAPPFLRHMDACVFDSGFVVSTRHTALMALPCSALVVVDAVRIYVASPFSLLRLVSQIYAGNACDDMSCILLRGFPSCAGVVASLPWRLLASCWWSGACGRRGS